MTLDEAERELRAAAEDAVRNRQSPEHPFTHIHRLQQAAKACIVTGMTRERVDEIVLEVLERSTASLKIRTCATCGRLFGTARESVTCPRCRKK